MKKVLISAPLLSASGYGHHSRQIFEFLLTQENISIFCDITQWGSSSWHLTEKTTDNLLNNILERFVSESHLSNHDFDECITVSFPHEWKFLGKKNIGVTAGIESEIVPYAWIEKVNKCDKVIVTSEFTKNSFLNCATKNNVNITTEINVVYQYFNEYNNINTNILDCVKTSKNILVMGQITDLNQDDDRKNVLNSLESLARICVGLKDVGIVFKTNIRNNSYKDYEETCKIFSQRIELIRKETEDKIPKVYLIHGNLSNSEVQSIYNSNKISVLVSLSKGEGFGRCLLEAAANKLPIIATDYSAYKEFLKDNFIKVDYSIQETLPNKHFSRFLGFKPTYAEYDNKSLHIAILKYFNNESDYNNIAIKLQKNIKNSFCKESIFKSYNLCLT